MKPYNIEIFDRQFNFRLNALVDVKDFTYKYDILSPEKNIIKLPLNVGVRITANAGTVGDGTICTSDYVRITGDGIEYTGVIIKIEKNENYTVVTYTDILALFDHEVYINPDDIKLSYIEDYLYKLLTEEFISTSDDSQKIYGLTLTKTSQTVGAFDFSITDASYIIINLLKDYISPAYRDFVVMTKPTINIGNKTINVTIGKIDETDVKTIEGDLPNVVGADYVIRQANDNKNKLTLVDIYNNQNTKYDFYLHASDYSFNRLDVDRITPVINDIEEFNSSIITEEAFWKPYNEALQTITKYNDPSKTLTEGEKGLLMSAFESVFPMYQVYARNNYTAQWLSQQISSDIISEAISGRLSTDSRLQVAMDSYGYNMTNQELLDSLPDIQYHMIFTIRDVQLSSGYSYPWSATSFCSGQDYDWQLTSHGDSFFGTWLPEIESHLRRFDVDSHLRIDIPIYFEMAATYENMGEGDHYQVATCWSLRATIKHDILTSEISSALNAYRESPEYQAAYEQYKEEKFADLLQAYANKIFKTSKYSNNIEIIVSPDDTMIKPLDMEIGQVVNIIHNGVAYNSILSGREIQNNGLVKLIFGTIRLELTKILNMKGI